MAFASSRRSRRARHAQRTQRGTVFGGVVALQLLFVLGVVVNVPIIQNDLVRRVGDRLGSAGQLVDIEFHGQAGRLLCESPLAKPAEVVRIARAVDGVHSIALDASCVGDGGASTVPATSLPTTTVPATTLPATTAPSTTLPATTLPATTAVPTTVAPAPPVVSVTYQSGLLGLAGTVSSTAQHDQLLAVAAATLDRTNVFDGLTVDAAAGLTDADAARVAVLLHYMVVPLEAGEVGWGTEGVYARGAYTDDAARAQFAAVAAAAGVEPVLVARPAATAAEATALQTELNTLVGSEPILFGRGAVDIAPESIHTVQRIAGLAKRYRGVRIEVQGHTDSEGDPVKNLALSEQRAQAVLAALVQWGVPAVDLSAAGFGETQPIVGADGQEIPEKSRRVVFSLGVVG
ncbi:MAG: hypothetical protein RLZ14_766 [Actinomycetota bacterium]